MTASYLVQHTKYMQKVFDFLRQHNLNLKPPKCEFIQDQTQFVRFIISEGGIIANAEKVKIIKELSPPATVKEVRNLIGMCT